jgi:hypothetical protein
MTNRLRSVLALAVFTLFASFVAVSPLQAQNKNNVTIVNRSESCGSGVPPVTYLVNHDSHAATVTIRRRTTGLNPSTEDLQFNIGPQSEAQIGCAGNGSGQSYSFQIVNIVFH